MHNRSYWVVTIGLLGIIGFGFQNCSKTSFTPGTTSQFSSSTTPPTTPVVDPTDPGGTAVLPPFSACVGSNRARAFDSQTAALSLSFDDPSVVFGQGLLVANTAPGSPVYAERFRLEDANNDLIFSPGSSYSPVNAVTPNATALSYVSAGNYSLSIVPESIQAVVSNEIRGTVYPLCGNSQILWYRYKSDPGSATSDTPFTYDVTLAQPAQLLIASEKTLVNVPTTLALSVNVIDLSDNSSKGCPLQGSPSWNYNSPSTPSVSGYCTVSLPAGHYRISNVIATDAASGAGASQHLGILAIAQ